MEWLSWAIGMLVVASFVGWVVMFLGLHQLPNSRPKVPQYDRFGRLLGEVEAPDYHILPGDDG